MTVGALIGFGLVYWTLSLSLSLVLNTLLLTARSRLRRLGPWAERRAAAAALLLPPLLAVTAVGALAFESSRALSRGSDHCLQHAHHLHLCVRHGAAWLSQPWALALVAAAATFVGARLVTACWAHAMAQRAANRLRALGAPIDDAPVYLVPSGERFAFTAGVASPAVVISQGAWDCLEVAEREAVVAHELTHLAHGDLGWRVTLGLAASLGAPFVCARTLRVWELAAERLCDRQAARRVGRASTVASAMVTLARSSPPRLAPAGAVFAAASDVPERVESLLRDEPDGREASRVLARVMAIASIALAAACVRFAGPLHHALETLLG